MKCSQKYVTNDTERTVHLEKLVEMGLETFSSKDAFYNWLKRDKNVFGEPLTFSSLLTTQGVKQLIDEVGRIQTGVYI
ncbi:hypothetical protein [Parasediminibacterium sp. JCM 36343]|uniref:hypothetical protein n=1 Tax=Parasediminibacterium sp. JCM 36343 TaxID=3374279 RepID=UPI003979A853